MRLGAGAAAARPTAAPTWLYSPAVTRQGMRPVTSMPSLVSTFILRGLLVCACAHDDGGSGGGGAARCQPRCRRSIDN